jgi:molybdate transport system substrate-binding protein
MQRRQCEGLSFGIENAICLLSAAMGKNALVIAVALLLQASCSKQAPPATEPKSDTVVVSAATSTKDVIETLVGEFSGAEVKVNSGPSNSLATQILAGAPADLFLSASEQWADEVQKRGMALESTRLLSNRLVLVVPKGNPAQVHEPKDLLSAGVKKIALAGEGVPAGKYADQALTSLEIFQQLTDEGKIVRGQDVRSALAYVERGEAEAGIVYSTDVGVAEGVETVHEFDPNAHDEIVYVLVLLKHGQNNEFARRFYDFLKSSATDDVYTKFGFTRIQPK